MREAAHHLTFAVCEKASRAKQRPCCVLFCSKTFFPIKQPFSVSDDIHLGNAAERCDTISSLFEGKGQHPSLAVSDAQIL